MMQTLIRRRNVVSKTRVAWAREGGARRRCTHARMRMALVARFRAGSIPVIPPGRSPYERVTVLRRGHALAGVARAYLAGQCWFDRQEIEAALRQPLATRAGAAALAAVGFALLRLDAARLELRAADPRVAHLVNRARLGAQHRGYRVRRVLEAFLSLSAKEDDLPLFAIAAEKLVGGALEPLQRLAHVADATAPQVRLARIAMEEAQKAVTPAAALCDIVTSCRMSDDVLPIDLGDWNTLKKTIEGSTAHATAEAVLKSTPAFHFPVAFPEVFLRTPPGFDMIIGNPPWEKARVEEHEFWARNFPGLRGMQRGARDRTIAHLKEERPDLLDAWEKERAETEVLRDAVRGMPGMNTGHPDLFRAFMWRFIQLIRPGSGRLGIVLPGDTFKIAGAAELREKLADGCAVIAVQMLTNRAEWVFDDVDSRKLISFVTAMTQERREQTVVEIPPEFHSKSAWHMRNPDDHVRWSLSEWKEYSPTLIIPLLPTTLSFQVIKEFLHSPRLANHPNLRVRRVYADFETTRDRARYHEQKEAGDWPVYSGESFDLWEPDTRRYFAYTNGKEIQLAAQERRLRAPRGTQYSETPAEWRQRPATHPIKYPRIPFRDVTNRTNRRTLVAALVPAKLVTVQTAPWVLWLNPEHDTADEAFLIGVLSSIPLDWWTRRFIEGHVDQEAFNSLRIPDPRSSNKLSRRVMELAGRLAAADGRFEAWAEAVGVECGPLPEAQKQDHIHELDAVVAHLYGLEEKHLIHIFETFHEGWDYAERLAATRKHYGAWKNRL